MRLPDPYHWMIFMMIMCVMLLVILLSLIAQHHATLEELRIERETNAHIMLKLEELGKVTK